MRLSASCVFLLLLAVGSTPLAQNSPHHLAENTTFITNVTVINTETGQETKDQTVILRGDRVFEIKQSKSMHVPPGANIVNGVGKYLIPGLWDMHVHLTNVDATLPLYVANGVTGVREITGPQNANKFRDALAAKHITAPHIYLGSPIIDGDPPAWPTTILNGDPTWPTAIGVKNAVEARAVVDDEKQKGADFIKIYGGLSRESYFCHY